MVRISFIAVLLTAAALASSPSDAQSPTRIRGTIGAVSANAVTVKTGDGNKVEVQLSDKTNIVFTQPTPLAEIRAGDFLGVTSARGSDGALSAFEIRRFPKPVNPGHRPFDGRDDQTMTNATVSATVQSAKGRELTLDYEGGSQKVVVAPDAAVSTLVPGTRAQLVPNAPVNLTAAPGADGRLVANNIQVSSPGFKAPQ